MYHPYNCPYEYNYVFIYSLVQKVPIEDETSPEDISFAVLCVVLHPTDEEAHFIELQQVPGDSQVNQFKKAPLR